MTLLEYFGTIDQIEIERYISEGQEENAEYPVTVPRKWIDNLIATNQGLTIPTGVVYLSEPKEMMAMFVNIPAELKSSEYRYVIPVQIPNPVDKEYRDMKRVQALLDAQELQLIVMKTMPFEFTLAYPEPYVNTWNELTKLKA
jgi:hypothetical protein